MVAQLCQQLAESEAEGYAECCDALAAADLRAEVAAIHVPMLIIAGENDPVTTVDDADFLHQQIDDAFQVCLPASHLSNIEASDEFNAALVAFLRRNHGG